MPGIDQYVVFGSHFDGTDGATTATDFSTEQAAKTITFVGNAQLDTAQFKFGTASLLLDGTGDYITLADSDDFTYTGDFTIDFQVRFNSAVNVAYDLYDHGVAADTNRNFILWDGGNSRWYFGIYNGGSVDFEFFASDTIVVDTWYHVALVRSGNNWFWFRDGTEKATTSNAVAYSNKATTVRIGANSSDGTPMNGWIDEYRISKGIARWTANFTPPSAPYSVGGGVVFTSRLALMGVG